MISPRSSRDEAGISSECYRLSSQFGKLILELACRTCWFMAQELKVVGIPPSEVS
jgi:hypothetical protein